jgi:acyl phosphate:glycerol-3-phosphate acyltransferase
MQILTDIGIVVLGYIIGSIPFGFLIVKLKTGKDIRDVESGRTGGTNAVRAAGFWAGLLTAILDILKGTSAVWIAQALTGNHWIHILAPVAAILGHNYSIFLVSRDNSGKLRFVGGAGGAPALGGAVGLWILMFPIVFGAGLVIWFTVGIASVTTMAIGLIITITFAIRAYLGYQSPVDIVYGLLALFLLVWSLRPNLKKLMEGKERIVSISLNGRLRARKESKETNQS